jgi:hypothetical protein
MRVPKLRLGLFSRAIDKRRVPPHFRVHTFHAE